MKIESLEHIYFLGIGGIGMSALARYFHLLGKQVSGYDKTNTPLTKKLEEEGMKIHYDENPDLISEDIDMVIFTPAIPSDNTEWEKIHALGVPVKKRAEVLGMISHSYKTIAIAGTHGKTSTSSMTSVFLRGAGIDCSAFLGGIVKDFDSNFVFGESDWVVVEADEFDRSFMHLTPEIAVLLSVDADHLDIYGAHDEMLRTFQDFTLKLKKGGKLLVAHDVLASIDEDWKKALLRNEIELYSFGVNEGWFSAQNVKPENHRFEFDFYVGSDKKCRTGISMPGNHNVSNACAAMGIADLIGLDMKQVADGVKQFQGIKRRFDFISISNEHTYIDDYAHHPSELKAAISAARKLYEGKKLTVIFQPHLYSRTRDFLEDFANELKKADQLILMDIYPAREKPIPGITSERIKDLLPDNSVEILSENEIIEYIKKNKNSIEILMTLGAGNIDRLVEPLRKIFN